MKITRESELVLVVENQTPELTADLIATQLPLSAVLALDPGSLCRVCPLP